MYGSKIRAKSGEPGWVNPEYDILASEVRPVLPTDISIKTMRSYKGDKWKQVLGFDHPETDLIPSETISPDSNISIPALCHSCPDKWKRVLGFDEGIRALSTVQIVPESLFSDIKETLETDSLPVSIHSEVQFPTERHITPSYNRELLIGASRPNPPPKDNKPLLGTPPPLHNFLVSASRPVSLPLLSLVR